MDSTQPQSLDLRPAIPVVRTRRILAWGIILLGVLLFAATLAFMLITPDLAKETEWGSSGRLGTLFLSLPGMAFLAVGGLIALRRAENRAGWLCLIIAVLWLLVFCSAAVTGWAVYRRLFGVAVWVDQLGGLWVPALGLTGMHLPLRLPDGELPSPKWRWYSHFCTVVILLAFVVISTEPGRVVADLPETEHPLASVPIQALAPLLILFPLCLIGALASLVVRYRRASGLQRLQLRWIAYGAALFVTVYIVVVTLLSTSVSAESGLGQLLANLATAAYTAIPISIGIAILRYRLYEIDILINRTLVYVPLTIILAVLFAIVQQLSRQFLTEFSGDNPAVLTVLTTLFIVAVFEPIKKRIERVVEKFSKQIPDPARTVKTFREKIQGRSLRMTAEGITRQLLEEVVAGFGVSGGAIYLDSGGGLHPVHATRAWDGAAALTVPLQDAEQGPLLGVLALGPQRIGIGYTTGQRALLQEMAQLVADAIEQDRQIAPLQADPVATSTDLEAPADSTMGEVEPQWP